MKSNILLMLVIITTLFTGNAFAKATTTKATFKVSGNCESCKKRIEKAAKTDGVKSASWNEDTKLIKVAFNPEIITLDDIQKNIAKIGYDTEKFAADSTAYSQLPHCCQYKK